MFKKFLVGLLVATLGITPGANKANDFDPVELAQLEKVEHEVPLQSLLDIFNFDDLYAEYIEMLSRHDNPKTKMYEGLDEVLKELKSNEVR